MRIKANNETGFTLVELILVIVLLGILSVVAAPSFTTTGFEQRAYRDRLVSALRYAQKYAVAQRCGARVVITAARFDVLRPDSNMTNADCVMAFNTPVRDPGAVQDLVEGNNFAGTTPNGMAVTPATVTFNSLGRATSGDITFAVGTNPITVVGESGLVF